MRACTLALLGFVAAANVHAAAAAVSSDLLAGSESGRAFFNEVLLHARWGVGRNERAAFIVGRDDGTFGCVEWRPHHAELREIFQGRIPAGTVAIIHTHPMEWPFPSTGDRAEANRLGIPIYVITRRRVTKAVPREPWPVEVARNPRWLTGQRVENFRCEPAPEVE